MNYYIFNSQNYILRLEYFGGLLIQKNTMEKIEISEYDALFLLCIKNGFTLERAIKYIEKKYNIIFEPALQDFVSLKILIKSKIPMHNTLMDENNIDIIISELHAKNYLSSPMELTIYPSFKCQLNCEFCFAKKMRRQKYKEYGYEKWTTVIESFIDAGLSSVSILGGEPSEYFDIINLLLKLNSYGIKITLTSNGQNWSDKLIDTVCNLENVTPIFSIESFSKSSMFNSNYTGDLNKVICTIKKLRSRNKACRINTVLTCQTYEEIKEILLFCSKLGIQKFSLSLYMGKESNYTNIKKLISIRERIYNYIEDNDINVNFTAEGCMLYFGVNDIDGTLIESEYLKLTIGCECGQSNLEIMPDGTAYPCAAFFGDPCELGNIFNDDWKELWVKSEKLNYLRNLQCTDFRCAKCSMGPICNGGCPAIKHLNNIDFNLRDPRCMRL